MIRVESLTAVIVVLLSVCPVQAAAQTLETGFLNRTVTVDGADFRYQVYVPASFQRSTSWPIILALHGGGEYGDDGLRQTVGGIAHAIRQHSDWFPAIVVIPQSKADGTPGWQRAGGRAALAAVDDAIVEFNGDRRRVYLTGLSAGGNGAWYLASRNPERFAALLVVCGWISERTGTTSGVAYPSIAPPDATDPFAAVAAPVSKLPAWLFHGAVDRVVPVAESRSMHAALKALGADVRFTELPGVDHNAWDAAYGRADVWAWLLRQRKP